MIGVVYGPASPLRLRSGCASNPDSASFTRMDAEVQFDALLRGATPVLALAPMQDVTDRAFWQLLTAYGGADVYYTEYFRVHAASRLEPWIVESIECNPTGRPVIAQMIGNDPRELVRAARELQRLPVVAIDLNLGCPAPVVYRKRAGGGLLREPQRIDALLGALRDAVDVKLTVKTRLGFDAPDGFEALLRLFAKHALDLVAVHGRTVMDMYRGEVRYDCIARAVEVLRCPVLANGNVDSAAKAAAVLARTAARGLMIGRAAIRNPWIFAQIRQQQRGETPFQPRGRDVLAYVHALYDGVCPPGVPESARVQRIKKHMNHLGLGVQPSGAFLHAIRRVTNAADFFRVCAAALDHDEPLTLKPGLPAVHAAGASAGAVE